MEKSVDEKTFHLEIMTPGRLFFEGDVHSLVIETATGSMGVLYNTLPVVTLLKRGTIKIFQDERWMDALSTEGLVSVTKEKVVILADRCRWPYEPEELFAVDEPAAKEKKAQSMREYKLAKANLAMKLVKNKIISDRSRTS